MPMFLKANLGFLLLCSYKVLSCPDGWTIHGSSCYHFSHDTEAWVDAVAVCQILGGYLVQIDDDVENQYLVDQAKLLKNKTTLKPSESFWIGLNDLQEEGSWIWVNSKEHASYTHWQKGEPNNGGNNENCAHLYPAVNFFWNDDDCHVLYNYICEKVAENTDLVG